MRGSFLAAGIAVATLLVIRTAFAGVPDGGPDSRMLSAENPPSMAVKLLKALSHENEIDESRIEKLRNLIRDNLSDNAVQRMVAEILLDENVSDPLRVAVLESIAGANLRKTPESWREPLATCLDSERTEVLAAACRAVKNLGVDWFDSRLLKIGAHCCTATVARVEALDAVADRAGEIDPPTFLLLQSQLYEQVPIAARLKGAEILARAPLSRDQVLKLAHEIQSDNPATAGPLIWPVLLPVFKRANDLDVGLSLVEALKKSPGIENIPRDALDEVISRYPARVQENLEPLLASVDQRSRSNRELLDRAASLIQEGNRKRGKEIFFSETTACYLCHRVGEKGGQIGPDLSHIGRRLSDRDLLGSVLFPNDRIREGYETLSITTKRGTRYRGIPLGETGGFVDLAVPAGNEIRVDRNNLREKSLEEVSLMPRGLEATMPEEGLGDLVAFLKTLK